MFFRPNELKYCFLFGNMYLISYIRSMKEKDMLIRKMKINTNKLTNAETVLTRKYGALGTESRMEFDAKARAYYYSVILRDRRKELKITQNELAKTTGMARSYIAKVERGETDIQLSSFLRIADALKMTFSPKVAL